jgi:hypothetical protein
MDGINDTIDFSESVAIKILQLLFSTDMELRYSKLPKGMWYGEDL